MLASSKTLTVQQYSQFKHERSNGIIASCRKRSELRIAGSYEIGEDKKIRTLA